MEEIRERFPDGPGRYYAPLWLTPLAALRCGHADETGRRVLFVAAMMRAKDGTVKTATAMMTFSVPGPRMATIAMASRMSGKAKRMSLPRMIDKVIYIGSP